MLKIWIVAKQSPILTCYVHDIISWTPFTKLKGIPPFQDLLKFASKRKIPPQKLKIPLEKRETPR
jgi:hypothetical protein